jgi:hypothetical protein
LKVRETNIYEDFVSTVKLKGKKLGLKIKEENEGIAVKIVENKEDTLKELPLLGGKFTFWKIKDLIVVLNENNPFDEGKVVAILKENAQFIYISPYGAQEDILKIIESAGMKVEKISLKERLREIYKTL